MKPEDWNAIKKLLFALFVMGGLLYYFIIGVMVGHTFLFDHPKKSNKITVYIEW